MERGWTPVVTAGAPVPAAGVVRDAHGIHWLTDDVRRGPLSMIDGRAPMSIGWGEGAIVGGFLPARAVACEVEARAGGWQRAEVGGGAWVAVLDRPTGPVPPVARYRDADGALVRCPLPEAVRTEHIADAIDACPACGALAWHRVLAAPEARHGSGGTPAVAVCGHCGHEVALGVGIGLPVEGPAAADRVRSEQLRARALEALARIDFPVFAIGEAWTGTRWLAGYGGGVAVATEVRLGFGRRAGDGEWGVVTSASESRHASPGDAAGAALEAAVGGSGQWPDVSEAARSLWIDARRRERRLASARAERGYRSIRVDGRPVTFATRVSGSAVGAAATVGGVMVSVSGRIDLGAIELSSATPWLDRDRMDLD